MTHRGLAQPCSHFNLAMARCIETNKPAPSEISFYFDISFRLMSVGCLELVAATDPLPIMLLVRCRKKNQTLGGVVWVNQGGYGKHHYDGDG